MQLSRRGTAERHASWPTGGCTRAIAGGGVRSWRQERECKRVTESQREHFNIACFDSASTCHVLPLVIKEMKAEEPTGYRGNESG
jgi:hypothetical protein